MRIGIIVAMDKEFVQLRSLLDDSRTERRHTKDVVIGQIGDSTVVLQKCGIGKVNAAVGTVEMIDSYHPDLIVSSGCAGGAAAGLRPTDVVVSTQCTYHDAYCGEECEFGQIMGMPARYNSPRDLVEKALALNAGVSLRGGLIVSGEWFVDSKEKMREILSRFPDAVAVDMESCSIAQTCYLYHVPFVSFRIISDVPLEDTKASQYFDFWNRIADGSFNVTKAFLNACTGEAED